MTRDLFFVGGFELDTQAVGQAVGEREVASDLIDVQDRAVTETLVAEGDDVGLVHRPRLERQLFGVL